VWFKATKRERDLEERLERLERAFQGMRLDWEDTRDKLNRLVQRFVKRAEVIERSEQTAEAANASLTGSTTASRALDPISQRILDRRARLFPSRKSEEEKTQ
jgi:hypothetical protein